VDNSPLWIGRRTHRLILAASITTPPDIRSGAADRMGGQNMSRFEVDSAAVAQASAAVQASATTLGAEVDRMMRHLLELQGSWKGQAAMSFNDVVAQWRGTQERVRVNLEEIQRALAAAGRQYEEVEQATARMFAG